MSLVSSTTHDCSPAYRWNSMTRKQVDMHTTRTPIADEKQSSADSTERTKCYTIRTSLSDKRISLLPRKASQRSRQAPAPAVHNRLSSSSTGLFLSDTLVYSKNLLLHCLSCWLRRSRFALMSAIARRMSDSRLAHQMQNPIALPTLGSRVRRATMPHSLFPKLELGRTIFVRILGR